MTEHDLVSKELRDVEKIIDNHYLQLPIMEENLSDAVWIYLAALEFEISTLARSVDKPELLSAIVDNVINCAKYPLNWLFSKCIAGNKVPRKKFSKEGKPLFDLGFEYMGFETLFTLASRGIIKLILDGDIITGELEHEEYFRYSAYNAFRRMSQEKDSIDQMVSDYDKFYKGAVNITEPNRILNPKNIRFTKKLFKSHFNNMYKLPGDWKFLNFTLIEFREIFESIHAMMFLHRFACEKKYLVNQHSIEDYFKEIVYVASVEELLLRLSNYSKLEKEKVKNIIEVITFGNMNQRLPDPALQPLIKVSEDQYLISSAFIISSSFERNFITLINRIPEARDQYLRLTAHKEKIMQKAIVKSVGEKYWVRYGESPEKGELPDIDLAIIDDKTRIVIICELKFFIYPAEPREVVEKSEEIQKGIQQAKSLLGAYTANPKRFLGLLNLKEEFNVFAVVVSENYIGEAYVQSPDIPVIERPHLIELLTEHDDMSKIVSILENREYLDRVAPYDVLKKTSKIGDWKAKWKGIRF